MGQENPYFSKIGESGGKWLKVPPEEKAAYQGRDAEDLYWREHFSDIIPLSKWKK